MIDPDTRETINLLLTRGEQDDAAALASYVPMILREHDLAHEIVEQFLVLKSLAETQEPLSEDFMAAGAKLDALLADYIALDA